MKEVTNTGSYTSKKNNQDVTYSYTYDVIESIADAVSNIGEDKVKALIQRMLKVDANNIAREKAKTANGDSTRKPLSEQEKADRKIERQGNAELLKVLKSKGFTLKTLQDLENL